MHWINFPLLAVMIYSGLRIYWANDVYDVSLGGTEFFSFFPESVYDKLELSGRLARGIAFHLVFAWFFLLNGVAFGIYLAVTGQWRRFLPHRKSLADIPAVLAHDAKLRKEAPPHGDYNVVQQITYALVLGLGAMALLSGFAIYKPAQLSFLTRIFGDYENARGVHFIVTISFMVFFVVHLLQVARAGISNFMSMVTGYLPIDPEEAAGRARRRSERERTGDAATPEASEKVEVGS